MAVPLGFDRRCAGESDVCKIGISRRLKSNNVALQQCKKCMAQGADY
jgi:hypothetical protein